MWYREFRKVFTWDPRHENLIRKGFDHRGACIMKNAMHKLRKGTDKGKWMVPEVLQGLQQHWASEDFQKRSDIAKQNRAKDSGASAYIGGSVGAGDHYERMTQQLARPPIAYELLEKERI